MDITIQPYARHFFTHSLLMVYFPMPLLHNFTRYISQTNSMGSFDVFHLPGAIIHFSYLVCHFEKIHHCLMALYSNDKAFQWLHLRQAFQWFIWRDLIKLNGQVDLFALYKAPRFCQFGRKSHDSHMHSLYSQQVQKANSLKSGYVKLWNPWSLSFR